MERAAHLATIAVAFVAIATFGVGLSQFSETQKMARENLQLQAETRAIEYFLKFNDLQKEVAGKPLPQKGDAAFWHHNMLLTLTEAVYRSTADDPSWSETVVWMLESQAEFLGGFPQECKTFAPKFAELIRKAAPIISCK